MLGTETSPQAGPRRLVVAVLPLFVTACFVATVALDLFTPETGPGLEIAVGPGWTYALLGPLMGGLAAVILVRDPRQWWGWALAWDGVFWVLDGLSQAYVRYGIRADSALPGENLALWFLNRFGALLPATVAVLLMIFPTGRFLEGRWGRACRAALVAMLVSDAATILLSHNGEYAGVRLPDGIDLDAFTVAVPDSVAGPMLPVAVGISVLGVLLAMASVVVRYRRTSGVERDRMRWLLWSVLVMAVALLLGAVVDVQAFNDLMVFVVAALPPVAMTIGIVSPRIVAVEDLLARTAVYGLLALVLVVADLVVVAGLTALLGDALDQRQIVVVVLLLTVSLYGPLRQRLGLHVRRLVLGTRANPYDAVAGLASVLEATDEGSEQLTAVTRAVAEAFGVRFVSVEVERTGGERLVATFGERPAEVRTLPITYRDQAVGRLVLPARGLRGRLSRRDEALLGDLVRQAATAARTSQMAEELQDSRERLVIAREEERRRIRRDLHDGLGPALSGVVFQVDAARLMVDRDPEGAKSQLVATTDHVKEVVADVRRLVHDLRPPALDDRGLVGALAQLGESLNLPVEVSAEGVDGGLPAAVEVAAYRIAAEALTNVARHAGATRVTVGLAATTDVLVVEVADDGRGIPADAQAGVGLLSLRERAAELGGTTEVTCPDDGGTVVRARLPMGRLVR